MKLRNIPASEWLAYPLAYREIFQRQGTVAVNDLLNPLWDLDADIILAYGGRGGGKSEAFCDVLLQECLTESFFNCYYGRKVFDTVRGSCFATIVSCIKKNRLEHLFKFSEAENSSMIITCRLNGNKFQPFGSDKADKLKSIKDPTHLWLEEFDQFEFVDFQKIYPALRTPKGANRLYCSFNTDPVLPNHWLLKVFFPELYEGDDKEDIKFIDLLSGKRVKKLFVNFTDNLFIDRVAYARTLLIAAGGNQDLYKAIAKGEWGQSINNNPWLFAWDRKKHMAPAELHATPSEILYLSFDFNRNPMACTVMQWYGECIRIIEVLKIPNVGTEGICNEILRKYPMEKYVYLVTGDYSGDTASAIFEEEVTNYTMIKSKLKLNDGQIKISPNPSLNKNRTLVNHVFYKYTVQVCPVKALPFRFDAENVKQTAEGKIDKGYGEERKDPKKQADVLDSVRYWINQFMGWFVNT